MAAYSHPEGIGEEEAIISTNDDATSCKRYATEKGYWRDEFVKHFCKTVERKSPEISRGYYARVKVVHDTLKQFVSLTRRAGLAGQVVILGAGYDTTYWQLHSTGDLPARYYELDLTAVTSRKCRIIKSKQSLMGALQGANEPLITSDEIHSSSYHLIPVDLRNVESVDQKLSSAGMDKMSPTLFIAECVLVYLDPRLSTRLIGWAGSNFPTAMFFNYEPFNAHDQFGQVMKRNIKARGCSLLGIDACPNLESQKQRYLDNNWSNSWAESMVNVYQLLPADEINRINRLEFLDEGNLLTQLLQHYCLSAGYNDKSSIGLADVNIQVFRN